MGSAIKYVVKEVISAIPKEVLALGEKVARIAVPGYGLIATLADIIQVDEKLNKTLGVKLVPPNLVESPWGQAAPLYNTSGSSKNVVVEGSLERLLRPMWDGGFHSPKWTLQMAPSTGDCEHCGGW